MHGPSLLEPRSRTTQLSAFLAHIVGLQVQNRLRQPDTWRLSPASIRHFFVYGQILAACIILVPEIGVGRFFRLFEIPMYNIGS
jgi:TAG lipase/lysophosphatidylethanolamine acyltransferase